MAGSADVPRRERQAMDGKFMFRAKAAKEASLSPKPWRRRRKAVVASGGEGRVRVTWR
jgi:hypothetical protein